MGRFQIRLQQLMDLNFQKHPKYVTNDEIQHEQKKLKEIEENIDKERDEQDIKYEKERDELENQEKKNKTKLGKMDREIRSTQQRYYNEDMAKDIDPNAYLKLNPSNNIQSRFDPSQSQDANTPCVIKFFAEKLNICHIRRGTSRAATWYVLMSSARKWQTLSKN
ncbi:MAG: hypothetical protein EZS28_025301 [Streblomastix strix]|uniref:Uncharacterized protein n=1 Tax=Streblomastix strix TaxID=222440 RepID=A0A5J4V9P4_9EUKA|nr:MAG: hypothetical protein EZS28_025301 [Streblomastix strix]